MQLHSCWDLVEGPSASVPAPSPHSALSSQWEDEKGRRWQVRKGLGGIFPGSSSEAEGCCGTPGPLTKPGCFSP